MVSYKRKERMRNSTDEMLKIQLQRKNMGETKDICKVLNNEKKEGYL